MNERVQFKLKAKDFDVATETINLSCLGAYCQLNKHIPLMTSLKIALALPCGDQEGEFDYVQCNGVVVRVEEVFLLMLFNRTRGAGERYSALYK